MSKSPQVNIALLLLFAIIIIIIINIFIIIYQVNIALLLLFAIIIFAIVGLEFYAGALNKTCYDINNLRESFMSRICDLCVVKSPFF